jgi:prevent-host-death family protein
MLIIGLENTQATPEWNPRTLDRLSFIMYTKVTMPNLINFTQARNNLSKVIDEVVLQKREYILIRDSTPAAVIIPYDQYQKQEEQWREEFNKAMIKARKQFKKYLKKKGIRYPKTEEEMYELVNKITGRH